MEGLVMGFYIEGPTQGKANLLMRDHGARWIDQIDAGLILQRGNELMTIVAIYDECDSEVACLAYDLDEFQRLLHLIGDELKYLLVEKCQVYDLCDYVEPEESEHGYQ